MLIDDESMNVIADDGRTMLSSIYCISKVLTKSDFPW